jgi:hypothetical protein
VLPQDQPTRSFAFPLKAPLAGCRIDGGTSDGLIWGGQIEIRDEPDLVLRDGRRRRNSSLDFAGDEPGGWPEQCDESDEQDRVQSMHQELHPILFRALWWRSPQLC